MLNLKKSSFFFYKGILLQQIFLRGGFLAFYENFSLVFRSITQFFVLCNKFSFSFFIISTKMVSFFFSQIFFFFFKPGLFLVQGYSLDDYVVFNEGLPDMFFFCGFCYHFCFFNLIMVPKNFFNYVLSLFKNLTFIMSFIFFFL